MWLTTQMHREEELAAMQYPAGNWSSSCNKIAGTCGTSQWPFECLAEGAHGGRSASHRIYHRLEVHFHYNAFPEPSLRDLRHYSCAVTALTEPQPITAHVHVFVQRRNAHCLSARDTVDAPSSFNNCCVSYSYASQYLHQKDVT
ncbi:uncharacterized protein [Dermacentor albipictus]|uniref:uncharacterized protein isoform X8 n=1 Tax=Dermacentor albipictus TaxID=60249 RepID=UPI0038FC70B6